jgi:transposase
MLPNDFPPVPTLRGCFCAWRDDGLLEDLNRRLVGIARLSPGRTARPRAGIIHSQSVKTPASGGVCGYDAGKRIKASKRHIVTDRVGVPVGLGVHSAASQDRDGAPNALETVAKRYPMLRHVFADGGYAGTKLGEAHKQIGRWTLQIVKRPVSAEGFEALPRRRLGERTLAWRGRCRRLSKDWKKSIASAEARVPIVHIRRGTRCLAKI